MLAGHARASAYFVYSTWKLVYTDSSWDQEKPDTYTTVQEENVGGGQYAWFYILHGLHLNLGIHLLKWIIRSGGWLVYRARPSTVLSLTKEGLAR